MMARGLDDLVVLVVNQRLEEDVVGIELLEDYRLPVLQDSDETDVFGLWETVAYDLVVVAREGHRAWTIRDVRPVDSYDGLVDVLSEYL